MKNVIKKMVPSIIYKKLRLLKRAPSLFGGALYDISRFIRFSSAVNYNDDEAKLRAIITATYHNIEKGLSLPQPRLGFGKENLSKLIGYLDEHIARFGISSHLNVPISVIGKYVEFNELNGHEVPKIKETWQRLSNTLGKEMREDLQGGVINTTKGEILSAVKEVDFSFFEKRFSCRQFTKELITEEEIFFAVKAGQKAPAVCNRQSGKVHVYQKPDQIQRILDLQGGARGFATEVTTLFCITTDLRNFHGVGERYQGWIDGGLFAMSFIYGLHAQGIGSCCLNWSKDGRQDIAMRNLLKINDAETIIMFVAAGHLREKFRVARSIRKQLSEVVLFK